jgi:Restriction endonuclease AspBHI N-terminal
MEQIPFIDLANADLIVDRIYCGGGSSNFKDEPLPKLLGVNNQGGFRYLGGKTNPRLVLLVSSFDDPDWPDHIDEESGTFIYFGDNKHPGRELHGTPRFGNFRVVSAKRREKEKMWPGLGDRS